MLAPILYSADDPRNGGIAETINADAAPSLNAAFAQIHAESGIKPIVLRDLGGARTKAQQAHLVAIGKSDTMNSDHREDFPGRAAADIDNITKLLAWNSARFKQIMADHGWHNMTNTGAPFPTEDWHYAKHGIVPSGNTGIPLTDSEGSTMYAFSYTSGTAGVVTFIAQAGLYVKGCAATEPAALGIPVSGPLSLNDLNAAMWDLGFDDIIAGTDAWSFLSKHCVGGKTVFTTAWAKAQAGGTVTLSDAQAIALADQIAAKVVIPPADLTGLATSIAALAKQEGTDQAALLTAIGQVDENTLATFGLKRA